MHVNDAGRMVSDGVEKIATQLQDVRVDRFTVMSNHVHAIVVVEAYAQSAASRDAVVAATPGISFRERRDVSNQRIGLAMASFKAATTRSYARGVRRLGWPPFADRLWQRGYYDRVIRDELEFGRIGDSIDTNPARWDRDRENPMR